MQCEAMIIDIQQVSQQRPWQKCQSTSSFTIHPGFQPLLQVRILGEFFCMTASWGGFNRPMQPYLASGARNQFNRIRIEAGCGRQIAGCIYLYRAVTAQDIAYLDTLPCSNQGEWGKVQRLSSHKGSGRFKADALTGTQAHSPSSNYPHLP
jgi:hypothetical protein